MRLLKSLRGDGTLLWGRSATRPVSYCIDLYRQGRFLSGDGDVRGELSDLVGRAPSNPRLRLESGQEVPIAVRDIAADAASIQLLQPLSSVG